MRRGLQHVLDARRGSWHEQAFSASRERVSSKRDLSENTPLVEFHAARDQAAARIGLDLDLRGSYALDTKGPSSTRVEENDGPPASARVEGNDGPFLGRAAGEH